MTKTKRSFLCKRATPRSIISQGTEIASARNAASCFRTKTSTNSTTQTANTTKERKDIDLLTNSEKIIIYCQKEKQHMGIKYADASQMIQELKEVYTQKEIAKLCGVSQMTVTSWKKGWFKPRADKVSLLIKLFNACKE
jgi:DNA-directed RNA polymerase specialized sigma subunit